jgi:GrpB-like predicted nucleotidyltransferase (UPF0157 family)
MTRTDGRAAEQTIGLPSGLVQLRPHDPVWLDLFEQERRSLVEKIGQHVLQIEQVGSTSIPGLPAKPIIDIAVAVESFEDSAVCIEPLAELGYRYRGELGIPRRHFFSKGDPRTHHLHMLEIGSAEWRNHLLFRDYLRAHPGTARAYAVLKQDLAGRFADNREAYTEGKSEFIRGILSLADVWMQAG